VKKRTPVKFPGPWSFQRWNCDVN